MTPSNIHAPAPISMTLHNEGDWGVRAALGRKGARVGSEKMNLVLDSVGPVNQHLHKNSDF